MFLVLPLCIVLVIQGIFLNKISVFLPAQLIVKMLLKTDDCSSTWKKGQSCVGCFATFWAFAILCNLEKADAWCETVWRDICAGGRLVTRHLPQWGNWRSRIYYRREFVKLSLPEMKHLPPCSPAPRRGACKMTSWTPICPETCSMEGLKQGLHQAEVTGFVLAGIQVL